MRMLVTAAPGIDESSVRRSELPRVYPKPGSRGSMTNFERFVSDDLFGQRGSLRNEHWIFLLYGRPLFDAHDGRRHCVPVRLSGSRNYRNRRTEPSGLLRVVLDDELFLQRNVDLRALGKLVNQDPQTSGRQPAANPGSGDRRWVSRATWNGSVDSDFVLDIDDVVLRDAVAGDVDLLVVHKEVAVGDQLTGLATGASESGAVHDVVETRLEDAEQVLTGLTGAAVRLLVVAGGTASP